MEATDLQYRAVQSRDARFDGWFFLGVTSTGIYCRPSCPATTPKRTNVRCFPTAAAAQAAGFRACRRCRPDASPGSPEWNLRADVVGRAMRLIADGAVDRDGVAGLAQALGFSERHLNRLLTTELGAGPLALARAQRAQTARLLIETTDLPFSQVAFAAGFASIRQFNDTVREVFALTPTGLRRSRRVSDRPGTQGTIRLRLAYRRPFAPTPLLDFLGPRAIAGVEARDGTTFRRTLRLSHGPAVASLTVPDDPAAGHVECRLTLDDVRDLASAVERCRRLLDLDADPVAVDDALRADPLLGPLVTARPGLRVPGAVDGWELAVRAVLGQQVSVSGARTLAGRLVANIGTPLPRADGPLTHLFPSAAQVAAFAADHPDELGVPATRRRAILGLAEAVAAGDLRLDPGADRADTERRLLALTGIGPWTAGYLAARVLADPDAFLPTDLGVRRALERLGHPSDPPAAAAVAEGWRPWRSYALFHLWSSL